ncbi:hypothetical protein HK101_010185 [Irineochytrium annulatum]|nr:hypothetical protein HK101_010185 [Irineochytrium annulatum]
MSPPADPVPDLPDVHESTQHVAGLRTTTAARSRSEEWQMARPLALNVTPAPSPRPSTLIAQESQDYYLPARRLSSPRTSVFSPSPSSAGGIGVNPIMSVDRLIAADERPLRDDRDGNAPASGSWPADNLPFALPPFSSFVTAVAADRLPHARTAALADPTRDHLPTTPSRDYLPDAHSPRPVSPPQHAPYLHHTSSAPYHSPYPTMTPPSSNGHLSAYLPTSSPASGPSSTFPMEPRQSLRARVGARPYRCPLDGCRSIFSRRYNCLQHFRTHAQRLGVGVDAIERGCRALKGAPAGTVPVAATMAELMK